MKRLLILLCCAASLAAMSVLVSASSVNMPSGTWTAAGPMNSARSGAATVLLQDGRILVTGGNDVSGPSRTTELFGANDSFSLGAPMNVSRSGHVAVVLSDGRVLVVGGTTGGGTVTNAAEIYDPVASTWTNVTAGMVEPRVGHTAALLADGRVLIAGGNNGILVSSTIEVFDPSLGKFAVAATMSSPRTGQAMTLLADGRVLIVGGSNGTAPVASTDIFDPVTGTVSAGPSLSVARFGHSATTLLNGVVVIIGGNNGDADPSQMDTTPTELFDPSSATPAFTTLSSNLATPREGHQAFLLPNNNNVLIVGGTSGGAAVASAELFTPQQSSTGVWSYVFGSTGSMSAARSNATGAANQMSSPSSAMQANGLLLVAGGSGAGGNALNSAELYGFATLQTDQTDYAPGTPVTITGSGWQPGEAVQIQLVESPLIDAHGPYVVTADASGTIYNRSFATDSHDINVKFTVTAVGSVSRAQMAFTDGNLATVTFNNTNTIAPSFGKPTLSAPMTVNPGGSNTVAFAAVWVDEGSGPAGTTFNVTATYGGQAMTSAGATSYDYNYAPLSCQVFYLVNPPTGTNTLIVNATASSGAIQEIVANLVSFNGVNQASPVRPGTYQTLHSANGVTVGNFTAAMSSNTNDLTLGAVEATFNFANPASNQAVDGVNNADFKVGSDHGTIGASAVSDTWTFTNPYAYYAYAGFSIQAANLAPPLTYTANPVSRTYGSPNPVFGGTVTGFLGNDNQANATTGTLTFTSLATATSAVGSYPIDGSGLTANNGSYTFGQAPANSTALTVTAATPTVTVTGGTFAYDGNPHAATATAVGVDGHTPVSGSFSYSYTPPGNASVPVNVGTYSVTANFTSSDPNYSGVSGVQGSSPITITPATFATVTLNNTNIVVPAFGKSSLSTPMSVNAGGSNTVAFAAVWLDEGSGPSGTTFNVTATYGGQAMTSTGAISYDYNYAPMSCQVFYLVNPPTGTNTLAVNATPSSGTVQEIIANLISFNGVNQTTPVRPGTYQTLHSANGIAVGSFTAALTSNTNDLTLGVVEASYAFTSPASNQTVDGINNAYFRVGSDHAKTGASTVSDTWSFANPWAFYAYAGFSIQAASITPTLTYTATPVSRAYGAANPALAGTVTGFLGNDTQASATSGTLAFTSPATTTSSVGSYAISGSGLTSGTYVFVQAASNASALTVTKATPTVVVTGGSFPYDSKPHAPTATAVGVDGVTPVNGSFSYTYTPPGNSTIPTNVGTYSVSATFTSADPNYSNLTAVQSSGTITITPATSPLTYTANVLSRAYGAPNPAFTGTLSGFVGNDTQASATAGAMIFSTAATTTSNVGSYAINGSGLTANSGDYTFQQAAGNATALTVTQATPTITVTGGTVLQDGNPHAATATAVGVDGHTPVSGSFNFTYTPPGNSTVPTGPGTYAVTASFTSADPNYSNATGSGSITLATSATLTYTANPASRSYGIGNPPFAGTVTGFIGADTQANATTGTLTFTSSAASTSNVGSYAILGSGLTANSSIYTFAQAPGNATALTITPSTLVYTSNPVSRIYGAANPSLSGTVTGFAAPDTQANATAGTVTFSSSATASSGVGQYAIIGAGLTANNGNYTFAQALANATALTITAATPTVTVTGGTFVFDGNPHAATATTVGIDGHTPVNGTFSFTYTPPGNSTVPSSAGTYSVTANFNSSDPNYNNATGSGSISITAPVMANVKLNNANAPVVAFGSSSLNTSMTVAPGGSNTVAFATVWVDEGSGPAGTTFNVTATYGGQAMTSAGATSYDYDYEPISCRVFYLVNPPTGANTLAVNATASSGTIQEVAANLISFNGVSQTAPVRPGTYQTLHSVNGLTVGSFTATVTSNPSDLTLGAVEATYAFTSPASNQTVDGINNAYFRVGSDHAATGASTVSDTWSFANPWAFYAYAGFSIQASSGPALPVLTYTANPASRNYGAANPAFTGTVTGFLGTDTLANSTAGTLTFTSPATSTSNVGSYPIDGSGLTANNGKYAFVQAASNATALTVLPPAAAVYYLAPAAAGGNDANNGQSANSPWLSPLHAVNCGDVIIAAPGSYSGNYFTEGQWGTVTCSGGNNVAWIKCATFDACKIPSTTTGSIFIDKPYWGVQGWEVDGSNNINCFAAQPSVENPVTVHHVIFANDIAVNCGSAGFGSANYGQTASTDYLAVVGTISYDTASGPTVCGQAISIYQPLLSDSNPGTHFLIAGNFAWDNVDARTCNGGVPSDGNGITLDSFDGDWNGLVHYAGQTLVEDNIMLFNGGRGIQIGHNAAGNAYLKQNTVYGNNTDPTQGACGEIVVNIDYGNTYISGNITATSAPNTCIGATWWDYIVGSSSPVVQIASGIAYSPAGYTCESIWGSTFSCSSASLTTINPNFNNPINPGAPNCSNSSSVAACMAAVIADYTPTNPSAVGYGYQVAGPPAYDPLFPQWLCNVNLPPGLITLGCN